MTVQTVNTAPIDGQKPGTSGLRKKTRVFMEAHYLENFVQSIFDGIGGVSGKTLVVGGDGRFHNDVAVRSILRMAAANGAAKVIVGQGGLLSTPAASHLIRLNETDGGIILSASHNPGGIDEDFGIKFNTPNGGPAPEAVTDAIFARTTTLDTYKIWEGDAPDIDVIGDAVLGDMQVSIVDPVADYADLMETLFDFPAIRALFADSFTMQFDAMCAITGPYAREILETRLGAPKGTVVHGTPLPDFGGMHPDPNPTWAHELMDGWKFFGNLMDDGQVALCGEESFGTGSDHVREKDGVWAVLMWLNIIAATGQGVGELLKAHWQTYGRNYYSRHDFEAIPTAQADLAFNGLIRKLPDLVGQSFGPLTVSDAGHHLRWSDDIERASARDIFGLVTPVSVQNKPPGMPPAAIWRHQRNGASRV